MDDIAEKLGISKKTIYSHFSTKTKLVNDVVYHLLHLIEDNITLIKNKDLNAIEELFEIKKQVGLFLKDEKTYPQFQLKKYYPEIYKKVENDKSSMLEYSITDNIKNGIRQGLFRNDIQIEFISKLYNESMYAIRNPHLFPAESFTKIELFQLFIEYHIRGIATQKGLKILEDLIRKNETTTP